MSYRYFPLLAAMLFAAYPLYSQNNNISKWLPLLEKQAGRLGVSPADIKNASVNRLYTDQKTQITYIYLQQRHQEVKVLDAVLSIAVKDDRILHSSGRFLKMSNTNGQNARIKTAVEPLDAVRKAAEHLKLKISPNLRISSDRYNAEKKYLVTAENMARKDVKVEQYWQLSPEHKQVRLVWNVNIDDLYSDDYWQVRVDATDGTIVSKNNLTIYETAPDSTQRSQTPVIWPSATVQQSSKTLLAPVSANYIVSPYPSRDVQWGTIHPAFDPWTVFGPGNPATTLGWHSTADTDYNITRGNNVFTFLGTNPTELPDPIYNWPDTGVLDDGTLFFGSLPDWSTVPDDSVNLSNKKFSVTNLFYWNNMIHNFSYQYGFTEAAGNFQASNLGRGGVEGDPVLAMTQDGHGINNANFRTTEDGESGRMRMYLWKNIFFQSSNAIGGNYEFDASEGSFNALNKLVYLQDVNGQYVRYFNDAPGTQRADCLPDNDLTGRIAIVDRTRTPGCPFNVLATNAQNAGASGLLIYNSTDLLFTPTGNVPTLTMPVLGIRKSLGDSLVNRIAAGETIYGVLLMRLRDASLDNTVTTHEYMHGITNRLTGGGADECLSNEEQAGEGWSDYLALMMTSDWDHFFTNGVTPSPVGAYSGEKPLGIRRAPYSTDMSVNSLTYANMATSLNVHQRGEIWCSALWEMTWEIIAQTGGFSGTGFLDNTGTGGNTIAMNLVMTALKLQPCQPGFLDSRDAILAADSILYNKQYHCAIWRAFARRGMGYNARQGSAGVAGDEIADFSMPLFVVGISDTAVQTGSTFTITHKVKSSCTPATGYILRDTIPNGFSYVNSSPAGLPGPDGVITWPYIDLAAGEEKSFTITLQTNALTCTADTVIHDNRDQKRLGNFTPNIQVGAPVGWTTTADGKNGQAWFVDDAADWFMVNLVSDATALSPGRNLSLLSFSHKYDNEANYDGGVVEYSADGVNWIDLEPYFVLNGYDPVTGMRWFYDQRTFNGNSNGWKTTILDLSPLGTTPIRIRFRFGNDHIEGGGGWTIDDIMRVNYCASRMSTGLYNSQNSQLVARSSTTIFLGGEPGALPLTLISFEAKDEGSSNRLQWKTESEVNVQEFQVEFSKDGAQWTTIGAVPALNQSVNHYSYNHTDPVNGLNYYRLKMKDIDGQFKFSGTEVVRRLSSINYFTLSPNPAQGTAHFYFSASLKLSSIRIYDGSGRLVKQVPINPGNTQYALSLDGIAPGVYVAEGIGQAGKELVRFAVQK